MATKLAKTFLASIRRGVVLAIYDEFGRGPFLDALP